MSITITYNGIQISTDDEAGPLSEKVATWCSVSPVSPAYQQMTSVDKGYASSFPEHANLGPQARILALFKNRASRWVGYAIAGLMLMIASGAAQAQSRELPRNDPPHAEQHDIKPSGGSGREANNRNAPPEDFSDVRHLFHSNRQQIGAGPSVPRSVSIQQGRPLPKGYGKRLDARALRGMPHYEGYEWRRIGSDIVLVAITTGVVYAILKGVLSD